MGHRRQTMRAWRAGLVSCASVAAAALGTSPALAQNETPPPDVTATEDAAGQSEIIVTARKRQESILQVPVVVTALTGEQLNTLQLTQVTDLPRLVPGLVLGGNLLSIGPQVTIRGVGTSSSDPGVDQSVSLNIDGLSLGQGLAFGSGLFDVGQVEVLKGPQSLFYGKSAPGGVISLRTADPGSEFELIARASYEIEAREKRGELIISGPLNDSLGLRLATTYSAADGYFRNLAVAIPGTGAKSPFSREPRPRNFIIRGTAVWKPTDDVSVRLKLNHAYDHATNAENFQLVNCPEGNTQAFGFGGLGPTLGLSPVDPLPFIAGDDCKLNRNVYVTHMDPAFFPGITNNGVPYLTNEQNFGTLEVNWDILADLSMTSTTAYYKLDSSSLVNPGHTTAAGTPFAVTNQFERREFTQELRLNSDFSSPLNFTVGGFYEDGRLYDRVRFIRNRAYGFVPATILNDDRASTVDIKTYSLFGQLRYKLLDTLELAGGVRWTDEERSLNVFDFHNNLDVTPFLARPRLRSKTWSPEATITYTPTPDFTVFASYKKGFKSGSFTVAVPANVVRNSAGQIIGATNPAFDDERVQGYEIGLKTRLFERSLLLNLAFYDYRYRGLQVGGIEPSPGGVPVIRTVNAGRARTYGIDFDLAYRPPQIDNLNLNLSVNWNRARYQELNNIPCYTAQTIAQGCTTFFVPSANQVAPGPTGSVVVNGQYGFYTGQHLSGTPLIRAPEWTANFGLDYELPVGSGMTLRLSNNNQYSSRYTTALALNRPKADNYQESFIKVDASIALRGKDERWEVALIGKNITDKITGSNCPASNFAGGNFLGGPITGGTTSGPIGFAEGACYTDPGRAVYLRLTFKPFR